MTILGRPGAAKQPRRPAPTSFAIPPSESRVLKAIISDIHGNLEALRAVLEDIDRQEAIDEIVCLGDIVGYGPSPAECVDLIRERCSVVIRGNHDEALVHGPIGFTPLAREAIEWTRKKLRPRFWKPGSTERWSFLEDLRTREEWHGYLLVHGSPRDPTSEYIMDREVHLGDPQKFTEIFASFEKVCMVGHTHIPGVFYEGPRFVPQRELEEEFRADGEKMVINVGSVGQPRDRDPRACYLLVDPERDAFRFRRVDYDCDQTRERIHRIPGLNPQLGDRLQDGI